jgi:integrase
MPLTATAARQAKPRDRAYKLADEKGLFLLVHPNGSKYWRLKYRFGGKEKTLALGVYPEVSLADAREKRSDARNLLRNGIDPSAARRQEKARSANETSNSFWWFETRLEGKSKSHRDRSWRLMENDLFPDLGSRPVSQITAPELLATLRKVEKRGAVDMAYRARQTAGQVFRYAIATGRAERDPSADLRGALKSRTKTHYAAITEPKEVGQLLLAIDGYSGGPIVRSALQLSALLFQRPGEIRQMEWAHINWGAEQWELPAERMKMGAGHIVPLSRQALVHLQEIRRHTEHRGRYVFPSQRGASRPLSENGTRAALRTLGYSNDQMTPHGFRAMARTLLDEVLGFRVDFIEQQLSHAVKDANGRAYNRTTHLKQRHKMMQSWADYLDELRRLAANDSNVVPLHREINE